MGEVKTFLYGMYDVIVFPCLVFFIFCMARMKKAYARSLFVFGCSLPVTMYCYIVYIYEGQRAWVHWVVVAIDLLAFSQIGWLGAALMLFGCLANEDRLKKQVLWFPVYRLQVMVFFSGWADVELAVRIAAARWFREKCGKNEKIICRRIFRFSLGCVLRLFYLVVFRGRKNSLDSRCRWRRGKSEFACSTKS